MALVVLGLGLAEASQCNIGIVLYCIVWWW